MFRPRLRCKWFWLTMLGVPSLVWVAIVLVTPTGWARSRLTTRIEAATGRVVRIGSVRLGFLGDLKINDLSLAEPSDPGNPWLQVGLTSINVNPLRVMMGCCEPTHVAIDQAQVRVWRHKSGEFEFGNLARLRGGSVAPAHSSGQSTDLISSIVLNVTNSTIQVVDDSNDVRIRIHDVAAEGSYQPESVQLKKLVGQVNGGSLRLAARLRRDLVDPEFSVEVEATKIRLDPGLKLVQTFVPIVARAEGSVGGRLNVHVALHGRGATSPLIRQTLSGHGSVLLDPVDLDGSRILTALRELGEWPQENHVGAVSSNFTVDKGRVTTEDLTLRAAKLPLIVAGWTDFDGQFDYSTRVDQMMASLPREARALLVELQMNMAELDGLRIFGTKDKAHLTLNGQPLDGDLTPMSADRLRVRATARKLRDRLLR